MPCFLESSLKKVSSFLAIGACSFIFISSQSTSHAATIKENQVLTSTRNLQSKNYSHAYKTSTPISDSDSDGDPDSTDCNDSDATVYTGATEVCDGVVNDCNDLNNYYSPGLSGWINRTTFTVTNSNNTTATNSVVRITVAFAPGMQSDFDDIRFTDTDGSTLLSHWMETKTDNSSAVFWVKVPSVSSNSNKSIYMYYGNLAATSASSSSGMFSFFDDFSNSSLVSGWTEVSTGGSLQGAINNGSWSKACNGECNWTNSNALDSGAYTSFPTTNGSDTTWEAVTKMTSTTGSSYRDFGMMLYKSSKEGIYWAYHPGYNRYEAVKTSSTSGTICKTNVSGNATPVYFKIKKTTANGVSSANTFVFSSSVDGSNWTSCGSVSATMSQIGLMVRDSATGTTSASFDYFAVKPALAVDLTVAQGTTLLLLESDATNANTYYYDNDGDSFGNSATSIQSCSALPGSYVLQGSDCNDNNSSIHPNATELCDGVDTNCDNVLDDQTYYRDLDGDGYGDLNTFVVSGCSTPSGYVTNSLDCNDSNANLYSVESWFMDYDDDGFGNAEEEVSSCGAPSYGFVSSDDDCNDFDETIYPGAMEICDGMSNDCDTPNLFTDGLDGWRKRRDITITYADAEMLDSYPVKVVLNYDTDMQLDFSDIRFTDSDGLTVLNHWLETKVDGTSATFWVNIPVLVQGTNTVYVYYGNESVDSISSVNDTFLFGDDFSSGSTLSNSWTEVTGVNSSIGTISNGVWTKTCDGECDWWKNNSLDAGAYSAFPTDSGNDRTWEAIVRMSSTSGTGERDFGMILRNSNTDGIIWGYVPLYGWYEAVENGVGRICQTSGGGAPVYFKIRKTTDNGIGISNTYEFWYSSNGTSWTQCGSTNSIATGVGLGIKDWTTGATSAGFDYFVVKQYANTEPQAVVGFEGYSEADEAVDSSLWYEDVDGDGFGISSDAVIACEQPDGYVSNTTDCNDADQNVNPVAGEVCDGLDSNCDTIDGSAVYYRDFDNDGMGDANSPLTANCLTPDGYVGNSSDCDDSDSSVQFDQTWYIDIDADGYGSNDPDLDPNVVVACQPPSSTYAPNNDDCNDYDYTIYPNATELCDGVNNDCIDPNPYFTDGLEPWFVREILTVTNGNNTVLSNHVVRLDVSYRPFMQPDFEDVRFTESDGLTELSYWLEKKTDNTTATFWIKVPSMNANSATSMYMYYGNDNATTTSNVSNVFLFGDDFSGSSLKTGWTEISINGGRTGTFSNGQWTKTCSGECDWWSFTPLDAGAMVNFPILSDESDRTWEAVTLLSSGSSSGNKHYGLALYNTPTNGQIFGYYPAGNQYVANKMIAPTSICTINSSGSAVPVYFKIAKTTANGLTNTNTFVLSYSLDGTSWSSCATTTGIMSQVGLFVKDWDSTISTASFDYFYIRPYASSEPTTALSNSTMLLEYDATDAPTWYYDGDGDGLGNPSKPVEFCEQPAGYVANSSDLNDSVAN